MVPASPGFIASLSPDQQRVASNPPAALAAVEILAFEGGDDGSRGMPIEAIEFRLPAVQQQGLLPLPRVGLPIGPEFELAAGGEQGREHGMGMPTSPELAGF